MSVEINRLQHRSKCKSARGWAKYGNAGLLRVVLLMSLTLLFSACRSSLREEPTIELRPGAIVRDLMVSEFPSRSPANVLDNASVTGRIYVFMDCEDGVRQVDFYLDDAERAGAPYQRERISFYDFAGTASSGEANAFDTTTLANGRHTITAAVSLSAGGVRVRHATFMVDNPSDEQDPPPTPEDILWSADYETGDLSQWTKDQEGEAVFNTGTGRVEITEAFARSSRYSLALTIRGAEGQRQAARIFRWHEDLRSGYYSAWYYFPRRFEPELWWNVFQFKTRDRRGVSQSAWSLNVGNLENGAMTFYLYSSLEERTYDGPLTSTPLPIPVGQWVHVEAFYKRATDGTGRIAVWQDGTKIYDISGVRTALTDYSDWSVTNYTDSIRPSTATIYIDDAAISTSRLGPRR